MLKRAPESPPAFESFLRLKVWRLEKESGSADEVAGLEEDMDWLLSMESKKKKTDQR